MNKKIMGNFILVLVIEKIFKQLHGGFYYNIWWSSCVWTNLSWRDIVFIIISLLSIVEINNLWTVDGSSITLLVSKTSMDPNVKFRW